MNQVEVKRRQIEAYAYFIGLVNICIFGKLLGNNGITYLMIALMCFYFFATITSGSLSDTLGRILRGRNAKGQYRNAQNIRRRALFINGVTGLLCSIVLVACAGVISRSIFGVQHSTSIMMVLAPALFLTTLSSVIVGCFRGEGSEMPATVAVVLRQLLLIGLGLLFTNLLKNYGLKVSSLLGNEAYTAMYGGMGVAIAFLVTELLVFVFLALIFWSNRRSQKKQESEGLKRTESFLDTMRVLYGTKGMPVLLLMLAQLPLWVGAIFYRKSMTDVTAFTENYGLFVGKYLVICGLVILPVSAWLLAVNARTATFLRKEEQRYAKSSFQGGMQLGAALSLFFVVYVAMMAEQLSGVFCGKVSEPLTNMLQQGSVLIVLAVFGIYFTRLLLLTGNHYPVLGCLGGMDILFIIVMSVCLNTSKAGVMALVYASVAAGVVHCLVLGFFACRVLRMRIEWIRILVMPLLAACVVGLLCLLLGKLLTPHLGHLVTVIVSLVLSLLVYYTGLLMMRVFGEQELKYIPGGKLIHAFGQMLRVF